MMSPPKPAGAAAAQEEEEERRRAMRDELYVDRRAYQPRAGIAGHYGRAGRRRQERTRTRDRYRSGSDGGEGIDGWIDGWAEGGAGGLRQHPMQRRQAASHCAPRKPFHADHRDPRLAWRNTFHTFYQSIHQSNIPIVRATCLRDAYV